MISAPGSGNLGYVSLSLGEKSNEFDAVLVHEAPERSLFMNAIQER